MAKHSDFLHLLYTCEWKWNGPLHHDTAVKAGHYSHNRNFWGTHFSSTNDCGSVRLNVVSTGSTARLMTSNQLGKERRERQSHFLLSCLTLHAIRWRLFTMHANDGGWECLHEWTADQTAKSPAETRLPRFIIFWCHSGSFMLNYGFNYTKNGL